MSIQHKFMTVQSLRQCVNLFSTRLSSSTTSLFLLITNPINLIKLRLDVHSATCFKFHSAVHVYCATFTFYFILPNVLSLCTHSWFIQIQTKTQLLLFSHVVSCAAFSNHCIHFFKIKVILLCS